MSELPYDYQNAELTGKEIYTGIYRLSSNGVPAALMSFTAMSLFKTYAPESISTANTQWRINEKLYDLLPSSSFVSVMYGIYDRQRREFKYSSGGHPGGFFIHKGEVQEIGTRGSLIGIFTGDHFSCEEASVTVQPSDSIIFISDGILEAAVSSRCMFGKERIKHVISTNKEMLASELIEEIYREAQDFMDSAPFKDDVTLLGIDFH
jgi:serine phosphatase RsbU (regulator of sigma subunit)